MTFSSRAPSVKAFVTETPTLVELNGTLDRDNCPQMQDAVKSSGMCAWQMRLQSSGKLVQLLLRNMN